MFNSDNFVSARFTNNARNLVEVLYEHDDELHPFMLDINDKDNLVSKITIKFSQFSL